MAKLMTRRRAIGIFAAAAGLPLLYSSSVANSSPSAFVWSGQALGAPAKLILNDHDAARAHRLIELVVTEVARLERMFSLYRDDSDIVELNRAGGLFAPEPEMLALLHVCYGFWESTGSLFDPTVQPVWELYRDHFAKPGAHEQGPDATVLRDRLKRVGFDGVKFGSGRVAFTRPGMAITLNGVAQGFVTDRVVEILREAGVESSLVDMGEERAIGAQQGGEPWRIGLAATQDSGEPDAVLSIVNRAVATSSSAGFVFDQSGSFGHILHPRAGATPERYRRVSVIADNAVTADALSTAFNLMDVASIRQVLRGYPDACVDLIDLTGSRQELGRQA
jgi:thiamine biosynthesis lipoprotein